MVKWNGLDRKKCSAGKHFVESMCILIENKSNAYSIDKAE